VARKKGAFRRSCILPYLSGFSDDLGNLGGLQGISFPDGGPDQIKFVNGFLCHEFFSKETIAFLHSKELLPANLAERKLLIFSL
jgi:hypothetical protein